MFKKLVMISLLGICVAMLEKEAIANVCLAKVGGTCVMWSGSIECDTHSDQVGSLSKHPKVTCDTQVGDPFTSTPGPGLILCQSPGGKVSPGIQVAPTDSLERFANSAPITGTTQGVATVNVFAKLGDNFVSGTPLQDLHVFCPNPNWLVLEYVACEGTVTITQSNDSGQLDQKTFSCKLDNCDTLGYFFDAAGNFHFDRRQYDCCQVGVDPNCL